MAIGDTNIMSQINQYEALTGRRVRKGVLGDVLEADIRARLGRQAELSRVGIAREQLALSRERAEDQARAARAAGITQAVGTGLAGAFLLRPEEGYREAYRGLRGRAGLPGAIPPVGSITPEAAANVAGLPIGPAVSGTPGVVPPVSGVPGITPPVSGVAGITPPVSQLGPSAGLPLSGTPGITPPPAAGLSPLAAAGIGLGGAAISAFREPIAEFLPGGQREVGAAGGALQGAALGSIVPGVGTLAGAAVGGIVGGLEDGTVICTELNRQGHLSKRLVLLSNKYRVENLPVEAYNGYMKWAPYVVKAMQKSWVVTQIMRPIGKGWAREMSSRVNPSIKGSMIGKILLKVGVPICSYIGKEEGQWASLKT